MNITVIIEGLIIAGISGVLAVIIVIINAIVNNYGEVTITINDKKKELVVKGGGPLLTTLSSQGIFIPSACGGRGTCGACKTKVVTDIGPIYPTEKPFMSPGEITDNIRLSCQIKVKSDIAIQVPDELFSIKKFDVVIDKIVDVTHDIKEITIRLPENETIDFKAGQYIQLEIPPYEKVKEPTQRAYSIASSPQDTNSIQLLIRYVPGGILTTYIFKYLKQGDRLKLVGPIGDFYMQDTKADMICIAGGSGMAPIKSIIYDMQQRGIMDRDVWYFFGARSLRDLFYLNDFRELEKVMPNFHFIPALSEPQPEDNWKGESGLITAVLDRYLHEVINVSHEKEGYLCGSPGMINACNKVLTGNNIALEKIYYDKFA